MLTAESGRTHGQEGGGPSDSRRAKDTKTRACRVLGLNRSTFTYKHRSKNDGALTARMQELAHLHRRWGLISIHDVCKREGLVINRKRSLRVYREQKLQIRHRPRRRKVSLMRAPIAKPSAPNQVWSMDFIHDRLENGRKIKVLNVVDDFSRVCVGIGLNPFTTQKRLLRHGGLSTTRIAQTQRSRTIRQKCLPNSMRRA